MEGSGRCEREGRQGKRNRSDHLDGECRWDSLGEKSTLPILQLVLLAGSCSVGAIKVACCHPVSVFRVFEDESAAENVTTFSDLPIDFRCAIFLMLEIGWETFPSTDFSSGALFVGNVLILAGVWLGDAEGRKSGVVNELKMKKR